MSKKQHWDHFWKQGHVTSFAGQLPHNYKGAIAEFWNSTFERFSDKINIIDLATGNGALAFLAEDFFSDANIPHNISAIDAAQISPAIYTQKAKKLRYGNIKFYEQTPIENLPFDDCSFNIACSQFGFEYCDIDAGCKEVTRVLKPSGLFSFISHSSNSKIHHACKEEYQAYRYATGSLKLFEVLKEFAFNSQGYTSKGDLERLKKDARCEVVRKRLNVIMETLHTKHQNNTICLYAASFIRELFSQHLFSPYKIKVQIIDSAEKEITSAIARLKDQLDATLDENRAELLIQKLTNNGLKFEESGQISDLDKKTIGTFFIFKKPI